MPSMYSSYHFNKGRGFILGHFIEDLVVYERKKSGNKEIIMGIQESNRGDLKYRNEPFHRDSCIYVRF